MARSWSDEDRQVVLDLAAANTPASEIAEHFDVSRNAILGLIHRMRQRSGEMKVPRKAPKRRARKTARRAPRPITPIPKPLSCRAPTHSYPPALEQSPTLLIERKPNQCAWPLWRDDAPRASLDRGQICGAPVAYIDGARQPYCAHHCAIAFRSGVAA